MNIFCPPGVLREKHTVISKGFLYFWHVPDTCDRRSRPNAVYNES